MLLNGIVVAVLTRVILLPPGAFGGAGPAAASVIAAAAGGGDGGGGGEGDLDRLRARVAFGGVEHAAHPIAASRTSAGTAALVSLKADAYVSSAWLATRALAAAACVTLFELLPRCGVFPSQM